MASHTTKELYNCSDVESEDDEVMIVDDMSVSELKINATAPQLYKPIKLGATFSFSKGPRKLFDKVEAAGATAFQVFISKPDNWPALYLSKNIIEEFKREQTLRRWSNENIFVHGHLHVNLASSVEATYNRCYKLFLSEVRACEQLGLKYYILHPGSPQKKTSREHAITQMARAIDTALSYVPSVTILIENMAGQGDGCGANFEEVASLISKIERKSQIGVCLDTQHLWASGYDLTDWMYVSQQLRDVVGIEYFFFFFCLGSKAGCSIVLCTKGFSYRGRDS